MAQFSFYSDFGGRHIQAPNPEIHLLRIDHCNQTLHDDVFQDDRNSRIKSLGTRRKDCAVAWRLGEQPPQRTEGTEETIVSICSVANR